jgi:hypothetical protein
MTTAVIKCVQSANGHFRHAETFHKAFFPKFSALAKYLSPERIQERAVGQEPPLPGSRLNFTSRNRAGPEMIPPVSGPASIAEFPPANFSRHA